MGRYVGSLVMFPIFHVTMSSHPEMAPSAGQRASAHRSWRADNGNGTFSNPLFFDEFSDPDLIRVGDDYYLTGTTMHTFPGLPVLHSKDLVNWELQSYALDKLDYGPQFRLEQGKNIYGQGIWAPCLRYHNGTFFIFSNVNGRATQVFTAKNPRGPWSHREMKRGFHDLSVLFDDDGKNYVVWGYRDLHIAQLNDTLDDIVPGTEHAPFGPNAQIGEGSHFYKINGKYVITCAWYAGRMRMGCARSDTVFGPYEVNPSISEGESFGLPSGYRLASDRNGVYEVGSPNPNGGAGAMHQGGIVQTQSGEWWGWSMMDANSVGRLTCLSPVTWSEGWPYFGLIGNLGRTPRIWTKPNTGSSSKIHVPYTRNDDFNGPRLANVWQWNHAPVDSDWSLSARKGFLRLHSRPSPDLWNAQNTLTQRAVGPVSIPMVELDATGLVEGDVAGLSLLNHPYAWVGVRRTANGLELVTFDERTHKTTIETMRGARVWLSAKCDFLTEKAEFSFSEDGKTFQKIGDEVTMIFQLKTFQGIRFGLFAFGSGGGHADFTKFAIEEPQPTGLTRAIPIGKMVRFENMKDGSVIVARDGKIVSVSSTDPLAHSSAANFVVEDRKLGRVALRTSDGKFITVQHVAADSSVSLEVAQPGEAQLFVWSEMPRGDLLFLSLTTHRYLRTSEDGAIYADAPGAQSNRKNGASFNWQVTQP